LTVVIGNLDLLCESLQGHAALEIAEVALRGALRGADLANRLLAFARRQPLQPRPFDLNRLVADMEGMLRRALGEGIDLVLKLGPGVLPAMADPAPVEAALANLAANARDAMPGGGRVTIETADIELHEGDAAANPEATPGAYCMLAMSDTGPGIDPEILPRVFEPFFTTKRRGKGTGLGLSTVYGFARQAGGHVTIESRRGIGTTVRLYLPRARPEDGAVDGPEPAQDLSARGETVLVVDEIEERRRADAASLAEFGYRVVEAESGREALARLREDPAIDVLLADMVMAGGMPGADLAAEAHKLRPGVRAVLTTGIATMSLAAGRPAMPHEILPRPHRRVELGRAVRRVLSS
ncbi:MAG: response regulator, partial [Rhodospirillaceae bacterium]|nr:response regulator [Rhodospirillaceae bacterium]